MRIAHVSTPCRLHTYHPARQPRSAAHTQVRAPTPDQHRRSLKWEAKYSPPKCKHDARAFIMLALSAVRPPFNQESAQDCCAHRLILRPCPATGHHSLGRPAPPSDSATRCVLCPCGPRRGTQRRSPHSRLRLPPASAEGSLAARRSRTAAARDLTTCSVHSQSMHGSATLRPCTSALLGAWAPARR